MVADGPVIVYKNIVENAIFTALLWHADQKDVSGKPYILHPLAIMLNMERDGFRDEIVAAAVLHDVVEDTPFTIHKVYETFPLETATIVDFVTRRDGETYKDYKQRVYGLPGAIAVKYYDSCHNLTRTENIEDEEFLKFIDKRYGTTVAEIEEMLTERPTLFDNLKRDNGNLI